MAGAPRTRRTEMASRTSSGVVSRTYDTVRGRRVWSRRATSPVASSKRTGVIGSVSPYWFKEAWRMSTICLMTSLGIVEIRLSASSARAWRSAMVVAVVFI